MITKEELKALIPHGKGKIVAQKAGVTTGAVSSFFNGKTKSSHKILKAALEVALECKTAIAPLEAELKAETTIA